MTFTGTNTYLVGSGEVAVIDPGPDDEEHLGAILASLTQGSRISKILVTHTHVDHSALARRLSVETGAEVYAFGTWDAGMRSYPIEVGHAGDSEGVDLDFIPDRILADGARVAVGRHQLEAIWTPGHYCNHICFLLAEQGILFSGDHLMAWSTTMVSPPGGDLLAFMDSLCRAKATGASTCFPGHGPVLTDPAAMIDYQRKHRREREEQIVECLCEGASSVGEITERVYFDLDPRLVPAAARNVLAHLIALICDGLAVTDGPVDSESRFRLKDVPARKG